MEDKIKQQIWEYKTIKYLAFLFKRWPYEHINKIVTG